MLGSHVLMRKCPASLRLQGQRQNLSLTGTICNGNPLSSKKPSVFESKLRHRPEAHVCTPHIATKAQRLTQWVSGVLTE